jgi:membrane protein
MEAPNMRVRTAYELVRDAAASWWDPKAPTLGAALAFYTALSLSPIVLIVIAISGLVFGREAAQGHIVDQLRELVGTQGAQAIETMLAHAWEPTANILAIIVGVATLLIGATGVFAQLQDALNTTWEIEPPPGSGVLTLLKDRLLSLAMILGLGFLLLVSLVINAALNALTTYCGGLLPAEWSAILQVCSLLITFGVALIMFTLIFKFLPDAHIAWRDVWVGASITAALFMVGKYLIGLYLGLGAVGSSYGAAGSFVVLLLWLYYSTQILLFGAEITQAYANRLGHGVVPVHGRAGPHVGMRVAPAAPQVRNPNFGL